MGTIVLVPGAWGGMFTYRRVTPLLREAEHEVYPISLTGLAERRHLLTPDVGVGTHIRDVVGLLDSEDLHSVVLVGHSYGGMVISGAAALAGDRIAHLVYFDAVVPRKGQCLIDTLGAQWGDAITARARKGGDGWRVPSPELALDVPDLPDVEWYAARMFAHPLKGFFDPLPTDEPTLPPRQCSYIYCTKAPASTEALRPTAAAAREKGWGYYELAAGHHAMISHPTEIASILDRIACSVTERG